MAELLLTRPSGVPRSQLKVDFSSLHDRVPHPDHELERSIEDVWAERLKKNSSLFTTLKFRYGGCRVSNTEDENEITYLNLGLTDYKTFVGTNLSPRWEAFVNNLEDDIERCKHTASPLGNGAVVETKDNCILVLKRSENVGEFPGHYVFPGGHSEPTEVGIYKHSKTSMDDKEALNRTIVAEMFDGITREVVEETGVPAVYLSDPLFIGISRRIVNARPTAFFFMTCSLLSSEILQFYKDAQHGFESTQLLSIKKGDLPDAIEKMPGCHQGGAALYQLMNEAKQ